MVAVLLIIGFIVFLTWILISYTLAKFIAGIIGQLTASGWVTRKIVVIVLSVIIALIPFFCLLLSTGAKNYTTAYIQPYEAGFKVTVRGKRMLMAHDPVAALLNHSYEDSALFIVPTQDGIIPSDKIQVLRDSYKFIGTIGISGQKMNIQLFYDSLHKDPCSWNGSYRLKLR